MSWQTNRWIAGHIPLIGGYEQIGSLPIMITEVVTSDHSQQITFVCSVADYRVAAHALFQLGWAATSSWIDYEFGLRVTATWWKAP